MRIPNGVLTSGQLYFIAEAMAKYGEDYEAVVDITTRQNLQLRGLKVRCVHARFSSSYDF